MCQYSENRKFTDKEIITGKKKVHKIIIHFAVAANEYANVVGERFLADDSRKYHPILEGNNVVNVSTWRLNHMGPNVNANEWLFCD